MTPEESRHLALALDALEAVKAWPEHAPAWWRATASAAAAGDGQLRIAEWLEHFQPHSAQARWFRLSALHSLTGKREHLLQLGRLAAELPDADRCMSFALLAWWEGLARAPGRASLRRRFLDIGIVGLLEMLAGQVPALSGGARATNAEVGRVAILAQHLSVGTHAGTAIVFNLRAVLQSAGVATGVFSAQELAVPEMRGYFASEQAAEVPPANPATWQMRAPGKVTVTYSDPRLSLPARWKSIARQIGDFKPDLILFVGLMSPLVWRLRERFPVLGMSLHTMPPLAPVDVWLAAEPSREAHWPGLPEPQDCVFPFRFWPSRRQEPAARSSIDVPADAALIVTTGNRLSLEMPEAWCAQVVELLERHPGAHWLLIGLQAQHHAKFLALHDRVRVLPSQPELAAWIDLCDIYLNPPRVGGGASIAIAMELGLPVASVAGSDGGDKIGAFADSTAARCIARVEQWLVDDQLRQHAGQAMKAKFREELDLSGPAAARGLLAACELARQSFEERQSAAHA